MSYSFSIVANSKKEARAKVQEELDRVCGSQAVHKTDVLAAQAAAYAFIGMLTEPSETESVKVSMNGSLGWRAENTFTSANVNVNTSIAPKQA